MNKNIVRSLSLLFLFIYLPCDLFSIDTNLVKYYPLRVNDCFVFHYTSIFLGHSYSYYYRTSVVKDSAFNGHLYFLLVDSDDGYRRWHRIDSVSNSIMRYDSSNSCSKYSYEILVDSLAIDSLRSYGSYCISGSSPRYLGIYPVTFFGISCIEKRFEMGSPPYNYQGYSYTRGFGRTFSFAASNYGSISNLLIGCLLNGVVFGDTTLHLLSVQHIETEVPSTFRLYQNYPNPFNPVTKIRFELAPVIHSISSKMRVRLIVYDLLGKATAELFDGFLGPGVYETEWNAGNNSSGIYICYLEIQEPETMLTISRSNKMILLK